MEKMPKVKWEKREKCGCVKARLPRAGKLTIRCERHRGKPTKTDRRLCYFDGAGQVRVEA
jgi:hypothetical protein